MIKIYTDGACSRNPGPGGWAYVIIDENNEIIAFGGGGEDNTTNQRMELTAAIEALKQLQYMDIMECELYSDSAYLINCMNDKWYIKWQKSGWLNSKKQPVANEDLWKKLISLLNRDIIFTKVKGHTDDFWNNYVDKMAVASKGGQK